MGTEFHKMDKEIRKIKQKIFDKYIKSTIIRQMNMYKCTNFEVIKGKYIISNSITSFTIEKLKQYCKLKKSERFVCMENGSGYIKWNYLSYHVTSLIDKFEEMFGKGSLPPFYLEENE